MGWNLGIFQVQSHSAGAVDMVAQGIGDVTSMVEDWENLDQVNGLRSMDEIQLIPPTQPFSY